MLELITRMQTAAWRLGAKMRREEGQTSSEYLVIAGVIVVALIAIMGIFRDQLKDAADTITGKITGAASSGR